jgi:hypothetical protein
MPIGLIHHFPSLTRLRRHAQPTSIANLHQLAVVSNSEGHSPVMPRKLPPLSTPHKELQLNLICLYKEQMCGLKSSALSRNMNH